MYTARTSRRWRSKSRARPRVADEAADANAIAREPERVAAAVRAIVRTQRMLRNDPARATEVGRRRSPPASADIIAAIVERDLPFYDPPSRTRR